MTYEIKYRSEKEMKDSGIEWLEKTPSEWDVLNIGNIGRLSTSSVNKKIDKNEKEVNLLNYLDVYNSKRKTISKDIDFMRVTAKQGQLESSQIKKGDVYFTPSSETIEDIGHSAVVIEDIKNTLFSYHIVRLVFSREIDIDFKKYMFNNYFVLNQFSKKASGTTRKTLNMNDFKYTNILLPLKTEQEKIANFLDLKTAEFDSIISKKELLIEKLEEAKKSLISEVVTGKVKILDGQLVERKADEMKDSGVEWLGMIPKDWELKKLKHIGDAIIGLTYSPDDVVDEPGTLVLRSSNVQNGEITYDDNIFVNKKINPKLFVVEGDLLICSRNGSRRLIGKNAIIEEEHVGATFGAFMTIYRSDYSEYIHMVLNSTLFDYQAGSYLTSTVNQLTISNLNNMVVPFPPFKRQEEIHVYLNKSINLFDKSINLTKLQIQKLKEAKQSLISETVTGKIDLRDWVIQEI